MLHYYIYYRVQPQLSAAIESASQRIQLEIKTQLGIDARLLKKRDDPNLWLEIYENVPENSAFEDVLRMAEIASGIVDLLDSNDIRHVECFQD